MKLKLKLKLKLKMKFEVKLLPTVGQSVLVSGTHLGPTTNISFSLKFSLDSYEFLFRSALFDERTGL
jgi:hypothetical protein